MGTPYRVLADEGLLESGVVRLQDRDTTIQVWACTNMLNSQTAKRSKAPLISVVFEHRVYTVWLSQKVVAQELVLHTHSKTIYKSLPLEAYSHSMGS